MMTTSARDESFAGPQMARGSREVDRRRRLFESATTLATMLLAFTTIAAPPINSLQISSIEVPAAVINGSQVNLACNYDLQGDQLYSVKWYKNYVEFYRYQPVASSDEPAAAAPNARQEFELNGINLNLAKCNATHVQLRQASPASEGTYKCEVSAESPSFATVSSERQMKIYDNSALAAAPPPLESQPQTTTTGRQLVYNINDIVNLTCVSGPSRPAAKLSWLLNDRPVSPSSKWLAQQAQTSSPAAGDETAGGFSLAESRLTLSFRLQPEHLASALATTSGGRPLPEMFQAKPAHQTLRLRCLARLSLEFATQTSVLVSGGKTSLAKVKHNSAPERPAPIPNPSPLQDSGSSLDSNPNSNAARRPNQARRAPEAEVSPYRWPRPAAAAARRNSQAGANEPPPQDPWPATGSGDPAEAGSRNLRSRGWSARQLRQQADHIDQLLRALRPNDLENPTIEAKLLEPEVSPSYPEEQAGEPLPMPPGEADEASMRGDPQPEVAWEHSKSSKSSTGDYQLNDLVKFTCRPRLPNRPPAKWAEPGPELPARNSLSSSWLVNGDRLPLNQINAFDGNTNKFYFVRDQFERPHPTPGYSRLSAPPNISSSNSNTLVGSVSSERLENEEPARIETSQANQTGSGNGNGESALLIEFTQSLFQAKELQLKCRTVVEQPLIEFESQLIALVPASPFIQANYSGNGSGNGRGPTRGQPRAGAKGGPRARNSSLRPQSSSAAKCSPPNHDLLLLLLLLPFLLNLAAAGNSPFRLASSK